MQQNQMRFPSRYAPPQPLNERPCDYPVVPDSPNAAVSPHGFTEGPSSFSSALPTSRLLPSLPSGLSIDLQASYSSSTLGTVEGMLRPLVAVPSSDGAQQLSSVDANPHANAEWLEVLQLQQEEEMLAHDARELSMTPHDNADGQRNRAAARPYPVGENHHRFDTLQAGSPSEQQEYPVAEGFENNLSDSCAAVTVTEEDSFGEEEGDGSDEELLSPTPAAEDRAVVEIYDAGGDELHSPSYEGVVEANPTRRGLVFFSQHFLMTVLVIRSTLASSDAE